MKKSIVAALAAGALVLSGCAKTEVTEVSDSRTIGFSNFVNNSVKSINATENLTNFYVYGGFEGSWNLFADQEVVRNGQEWEYTPVKYWIENVNYFYAAYSNNNDNANVTDKIFDGGVTNELSFNFLCADPVDDDLLYATSAPAAWDGQGAVDKVPFTFKHILSKIAFKFTKSADLNGVDLKINNIKINPMIEGAFRGAPLDGADQYPLTCWQATGEAGDVPFNDLTIEEDGGSATTEYRVVVPQSLTEEYIISFDVTFIAPNESGVIEEGGATETVNLTAAINGTENNVWNPGYVYTYSATIAAENLYLTPIEFTATVSEWTDAAGTDLVIE